VKQRAAVATACEYELTQRRQFRFETDDARFQGSNALLRDLKLGAALIFEAGIRELRTNGKQMLLNLREHRHKRCVFQERCGGADEGVQFIHIAVGFDADVMFPDLRAVEQACVAAIAGLRVDFGQWRPPPYPLPEGEGISSGSQ